MLYLDNLQTEDMTSFDDHAEAIQAFNSCQMECQLSNEDGEIIAEKLLTDDGDGFVLEGMTQWDEVGHEMEEVEL